MRNFANNKKFFFVTALMLLWGSGIAVSIFFLGRYEFTAGDAGTEITSWPAQLPIAFDASRQNLVVAAHPHCPCSRVSLRELKTALKANATAAVHVVYYQPQNSAAEWRQTELVSESAELTGATLHFDTEGEIAAMLGARTSFDIFLFDTTRRVIFRGGITRGRGVSGVNPGRAALEAALRGNTAAKVHPVYGCPLQKNPKNQVGGV